MDPDETYYAPPSIYSPSERKAHTDRMPDWLRDTRVGWIHRRKMGTPIRRHWRIWKPPKA